MDWSLGSPKLQCGPWRHEAGTWLPSDVKMMGLLLFRKTADRLITYRKLTRTPKEYWGPKNTTPFLNLGPSGRTLPHPDTRLRRSPEPCVLAPEGLSVHGVLSMKLIWEAARVGVAFFYQRDCPAWSSACLTWLIFIISYEILLKIQENFAFSKTAQCDFHIRKILSQCNK